MSKILAFLREEDGASAAEYALILAIVCGLIVLAMIFLGKAIVTAVDAAATCLNQGSLCTSA